MKVLLDHINLTTDSFLIYHETLLSGSWRCETAAGGHAINLIIGGNLASKWVAEMVHLLLNQFPPRVKPTERSSHSISGGIIKEKMWHLTEREKNNSEIQSENLHLVILRFNYTNKRVQNLLAEVLFVGCGYYFLFIYTRPGSVLDASALCKNPLCCSLSWLTG